MKSSTLTLEASMIPSGEDLTGPFRGFHTCSVCQINRLYPCQDNLLLQLWSPSQHLLPLE